MHVDAREGLEKLEPEERAHPDVMFERVQIFMGLEKWDSALAIIGGMLNACAADPELLLSCSKAAREAGDFASAKGFLLRCRARALKEPLLARLWDSLAAEWAGQA